MHRVFGKWRLTAAFVAMMLAVPSVLASASTREDSINRMDNAAEVMQQIMGAPDKGIPEEVIHNAKCVLVIPHLVKGGFVFGGKYGRGVGMCRTANGTWSAPAFVLVGGGSFGLQIGVEGVDLVMLVMNDKGLDKLLSSKFELSGEASAAAGPVGRHASAGTDWKLETELLTYSRSKGAFAGATVEGAVIKADEDAIRSVYGADDTFKAILTGKVASPASTQKFRAAVMHADHQSKEHEAAEHGGK
jgi:lipid-binding SYLF domain-containing protein